MVEVYQLNQQRFTADVAPQYIYSPRELSRWVRALYDAIEPLEAVTLDELVRLWAHEVKHEPRTYTDTQIQHTNIHSHTYTQTHIHTYTHTHIHTYTHTHKHTYTQTHTHTHIHTYTYMVLL